MSESKLATKHCLQGPTKCPFDFAKITRSLASLVHMYLHAYIYVCTCLSATK